MGLCREVEHGARERRQHHAARPIRGISAAGGGGAPRLFPEILRRIDDLRPLPAAAPGTRIGSE
jgi:hypothetical protein